MAAGPWGDTVSGDLCGLWGGCSWPRPTVNSIQAQQVMWRWTRAPASATSAGARCCGARLPPPTQRWFQLPSRLPEPLAPLARAGSGRRQSLPELVPQLPGAISRGVQCSSSSALPCKQCHAAGSTTAAPSDAEALHY